MPNVVSFTDKALASVLDSLTSVACVAYWAGVWSLLDSAKCPHVISGISALVLVFGLAVTASNEWLETRAKTMHPMVEAITTWTWTCMLAVLSLIIWRVCWWSVDEQMFDPKDLKHNAKTFDKFNDKINVQTEVEILFGTPGRAQMSYAHAIAITVLGSAILIWTGRFRSASHAPPIGIMADLHITGERFAQASYSGSKVKDVVIDFVLTLPVVFVWAGVWMCFDNLKIPPLLSAIVCNAVVAAMAIGNIDDKLRVAFEGLSTTAHHIGDIAFTSLLVLVVVGSWRGIWESIAHATHMSKHPHIQASLAIAGAVGLTLMRRHRSAIFPPIDFSSDDGDHFATVGHTDPDTLLGQHANMPLSAHADEKQYNSA